MKVVFVVGATASGKSDWALRLAEKFQGSVVNCDSVQVYREVEIGTAKPSLQERARAPHFLFDYVSPPREMTVGEYYRDFFQTMEAVKTPVVFVVGGTGFYFQAIEKGLYPVLQVPESIKKQVEAELASGHRERLWVELQQADPETAAELHPNDTYRIGRALEIWRAFQKPFSKFKQEFEEQKKSFPWPLLKIGPLWEREVLRERIRLRTQQMLAAGLLEEARLLRDQGLSNWAPLQSVGYKESLEALEKGLDLKALEEQIFLSTSQLAKRQMTWFKRDSEIQWFSGSTGFLDSCNSVEHFLNQ